MRRRMIGSLQGKPNGPLLVCIAGMHGNEPAGVIALEKVFDQLKAENERNPNFRFDGALLGTLGNKYAYDGGLRYLVKDLNRSLHPSHVDKIMSTPKSMLRDEDMEIYKLVRTIEKEIEQYEPTEIVVLDLHTTTAAGGIFAIASEHQERSKHIAVQLKVPVITGFEDLLSGTTLEYFNHSFAGLPCTGLVFEAGQHKDPKAVDRSIAVVINCLIALGIVDTVLGRNTYNDGLMAYSQDLPKLTSLLYVHRFDQSDGFVMRPGYFNFQQIKKGEHLADDELGAIHSPYDGLMLMPLYQNQGEDGFFIVQEEKSD